ncbi:hypothetical protein [Ideonella sp. BN130291]|uniref:hypothetical protein n=1 Tax=Ideonella sp. BN130291 TaxID=3112940 RepID=UPI002E261A3B|nr:hypothetical protein [Ideonella sp. BN130291]
MLCHSVPPIPSWRPNKMPLMDELPFPSDLDTDDDDDLTPEPPEYGPVPHVIVH